MKKKFALLCGRWMVYVLLIGLSASCISNKRIIYMQDQGSDSPIIFNGEMIPYVIEDYRLQVNDIVDINIKTSSKEMNEVLELFQDEGAGRNAGMQGVRTGGDIFFINGFSIDDRGNVELPLLGELKFEGLTTKQAKELIEMGMEEFVNKEDLFVRVRLGGIRYSALGEFRDAGKHNILQNRATIFEAIANAGDLTDVAKRDELVLVRQYPEGSRIHRINLNNKNLMSSEFYFIQPNDMLYAEPMKVRELGTGVTFIQTFQLAVTTFSAVLLVLNAIN